MLLHCSLESTNLNKFKEKHLHVESAMTFMYWLSAGSKHFISRYIYLLPSYQKAVLFLITKIPFLFLLADQKPEAVP